MKDAPLLRVQDLEVAFPLRRGWLGREVGSVKAVSGVSFTIGSGQILGLVGESGCGKSTTARAVLKLVEPTGGKVWLDGQDLSKVHGHALRKLRRKAQMIFQDPYASLNPRMTVFDIIAEPLRAHGMVKGRDEAIKRVASLMERVGLGVEHLSRYAHEFSGGQRQRVGIARALALSPKLIVADEPMSALDVSIRAQIINLMLELHRDLGMSYLFIAHDLAVVRHICQEVAVMYLGRIVEQAPTQRLYEQPQHPYTQALLAAVPIPDPRLERARKRLPLAGEVPSPLNPPSGCAFHPRCSYAIDRCRIERPLLEERDGHAVACHLESAPGG